MDDLRIYITGAAGVGKTTLAKSLSEKLSVPFISSSAKDEVWPTFGFKSYNEAHIKSSSDLEIGLKYQNHIFHSRQSILPVSRWVTDRSPVDNLAYFLLQLSHYDLEDAIVENYLYNFRSALFKGTHLIYLKHNDSVILEDDGNRVINKVHQMVVDSLIEKSLNILLPLRLGIKVLVVDAFSKEKDFLVNFINQIIYE